MKKIRSWTQVTTNFGIYTSFWKKLDNHFQLFLPNLGRKSDMELQKGSVPLIQEKTQYAGPAVSQNHSTETVKYNKQMHLAKDIMFSQEKNSHSSDMRPKTDMVLHQ